jgi:hypothetical protein
VSPGYAPPKAETSPTPTSTPLPSARTSPAAPRVAGRREQREEQHESGTLREGEDGEHGQAPRDETGQEVGASPRDARPERKPESDHAPGA